MAFNDTLDGHPATFEGAVNLYGLNRVGRATRPKAATWSQQWADQQLIKAHQTHHQYDNGSPNTPHQAVRDMAHGDAILSHKVWRGR